MKFNPIFYSVFLIFLLGCSNDDDGSTTISEQNFIIFGHFYDNCFGEGCVETFKLTDKKLLEDTIHDYSGQDLDFAELENDKFEQVKDLVDFFPNQLLYDSESIFGCPDCEDGARLFIQYSENGILKSWRIDQIKSNVPSYLHDFMDKVYQKIELINDNDDSITISEQNFLIFGHFYGLCSGERCVETFKLTDKKLFEDTIDDYFGQDLNFEELENDKFEQIKDLVDFFPNQLLNDGENFFGTPDVVDQGGLFIQYSDNGNIKSWRIDQDKYNVPIYLHNFIDKVNEKIRLINN